jgi:hypothetical protein
MKVESQAAAATPSRVDKADKAPAQKTREASLATSFDLRNGVTREFLQSALTTQIGKNVESMLGKNGLSLYDAVGADWSAEATSDRIVAGTTALLGVFARQNPELSDTELLDRFESTIRAGIDRGYREALGILEAVSTFSPEVRELGQKTISMTQDKLTTWFAEQRDNLAKSAETKANAEATPQVEPNAWGPVASAGRIR